MKKLGSLLLLVLLFALPLTAEESEWTGHIKGGIAAQEGNSSSSDLHGDFYGERATEVEGVMKEILSFHAHGYYSESEGSVSKNQLFLQANFKKFFRDRWYWFVGQRLDHDAVKDLVVSSHSTGGVGFWAFREEEQSLFLATGVGYQYKKYERYFDRGTATVNGEATYSRNLTSDLLLTSSANAIVPLIAPGEFTFLYEIVVTIPFGEGWGFDAGLYFDYENRPAPGNKSLDRQFRGSVGYYF